MFDNLLQHVPDSFNIQVLYVYFLFLVLRHIMHEHCVENWRPEEKKVTKSFIYSKSFYLAPKISL